MTEDKTGSCKVHLFAHSHQFLDKTEPTLLALLQNVVPAINGCEMNLQTIYIRSSVWAACRDQYLEMAGQSMAVLDTTQMVGFNFGQKCICLLHSLVLTCVVV